MKIGPVLKGGMKKYENLACEAFCHLLEGFWIYVLDMWLYGVSNVSTYQD